MSLLQLRACLMGRRPAFFAATNPAHTCAIRGPKKKKGGAAIALPDNPDIVNIFKEGKDAPVYPSDMYPPFVMQLLEQTYTPDEIMLQMYRGERIPSAKEQWTLSQGLYRVAIKDRNLLVKQRYEYESDDDMGEDLGGGLDGADLDVEAGGELEEGAE